MLSPEDLARVVRWHGEGVPLWLVLQAIGEVFAQAASRRPRRLPRSLAYCEPAVVEAWEELQEGRLGRRGSAEDPSADTELAGVLSKTCAALRKCRAPDSLKERIATRLEGLVKGEERAPLGEDLIAGLEAELHRGCLESLSPEERQAIEERAAEEVAPYAGGMTEPVRQRALLRSRARLVRERFALPDLSLLPLLGP